MNLKTFLISCCFYLLLVFLPLPASYAETPKILTSIRPIHSLVSGLTQGLTEPELLIKGFQSPHDYSLRPSDRRLISQADLIVYSSPVIEGFLPDILKPLNTHKRIIDLSRSPGLDLLPARQLHDHDHHTHDMGHDGHIWLSINNARAIVNHLHRILCEMDPQQQAHYTENRDHLLTRLEGLDNTMHEQLDAVREQPFLMFHDAFQYFEKEFGLNHALFVTTGPEHKIGIQRVRYLKQQIKQQNINCVYYEPPEAPKIIQTIMEDQPLKLHPLDPVGSELIPGSELYFQLMHNIAQQLHNCMSQQHSIQTE